MTAQGRSEIKELLARHGLRPVHRLGQHFLADPNITRKIVEVAGLGGGESVVEIGAGTGTLTRELASVAAHVVAYEYDENLRPILEEATRGLPVDLRFADVMAVDLRAELSSSTEVMVANLPYNVGTPVLLRSLRQVPQIRRFVVMLQGEVAERLVATPGSKEYGLPSVVAGLYGVTKLEFRVSPQVFVPAPSVDSAVVRIDRIVAHPGAERAIEIAGTAFNQRRKMLRRSLGTIFDDPQASLENAGISPTARPEELAPNDFLRLADA